MQLHLLGEADDDQIAEEFWDVVALEKLTKDGLHFTFQPATVGAASSDVTETIVDSHFRVESTVEDERIRRRQPPQASREQPQITICFHLHRCEDLRAVIPAALFWT